MTEGVSSIPKSRELHLPTPKRYLSEADLAHLLGCSVRAFRQRPNKPKCIQLSPRKRIYDPDEVQSWLDSLPRK